MKFALVALLAGSLVAAATAAPTAQKRDLIPCLIYDCTFPDNTDTGGSGDGAVTTSLSTGAIGLCALVFTSAKLCL